MEQHNKLKKNIIERIQKERIVPHSKIHFLLRNILFWSGAVLFLVGGSLAMSVLLFRLSNTGIILSSLPRFEGLTLITTLIPLTWIVLFGIFLYISYKEIRNTKKGYKLNVLALGIIVVCMSTLGGVVVYLYGGGYILDTISPPFIPFHRSIESMDQDQWLRPHMGRLVGTVTELGESSLFIIDPFQEVWEILITEEKLLEDITVGDRIRIEGTRNDKNVFYGESFTPWEIRGRGMFERNSPMPRSNR